MRIPIEMGAHLRNLHNGMKRYHLERQIDLCPEFAVSLPLCYNTKKMTSGFDVLPVSDYRGAEKLNYDFIHRSITYG